MGDAIQYDDDDDGDIDGSDSIVFVTSRISNYQYQISNASGGAPTEVDQDTDWSLFRAYTSLANAESGTENTGIDSDLSNFDGWGGGRDLVTNGEQWNIACYANGTTGDTAQTTVSGWTTGVNNYIKVYTPVEKKEVGTSQRHSGAWGDNKYHIDKTATGAGVYIEDEHVRIDGLQIYVHNPDSGWSMHGVHARNQTLAADVRVSNCVMKYAVDGGATGLSPSGIKIDDDDITAYLWNNVLYDFMRGIYIDYSNTDYIYNNSIVDSLDPVSGNSTGIYRHNTGTVVAKNNIVYDFYDGFNGTFDSASTHNVTDNSVQDGSFGATWSTGTTDGTTTDKLVDSGATFVTDGVQVGSIVVDTSNTQYTYVTAIDSETQLSVNDDYFASGENYSVYTNLYGSVDFVDESGDDFYLAGTDTLALAKGMDLSTDGNLSFSTDIDGDIREDNFSIGADEGTPTKIYRSVGPGNTTALAIGADNDLTISGSTATFDEPLPNHIGVGDAIQYDDDSDGDIDSSDSIVFIHGRTSATEYTVKTAAGAAPTAVTNDNDWSIFRAYISLANWEAGTENTGIDSDLRAFDAGNRDIATNGEQWNVACYGDGTDTDTVNLSGWTTSEDNNIYVYAPYLSSEVGQSQRHEGKWNAGRYHLVVENADVMDLGCAYIWVDGLQLMLNDDSVNDVIEIWGGYNAELVTGIKVSNNIMRSVASTTSAVMGVRIPSLTPTGYIKMWNNIIYDIGLGTNSSGFYFRNGYNDFYVHNNTVVNAAVGYYAYSTPTILMAKNNIAQDCTDGYYQTFTTGTTNNLSDIASDAPGTNPMTANVSFVDESGDDFRLAASDTAAKGKGVNLYSNAEVPITIDAEGELRPQAPTVFDLGADQISAVERDNYTMSLYKDSSRITSTKSSISTYEDNIPENQWTHVAFARDLSNQYIYINGTERDSSVVSDFLFDNNGKLYIGAQDDGSNNSFSGWMDEIRIYNYARSANEIRKDRAAGSSGRAATRAKEGVSAALGGGDAGISDGLVAYWKMDEVSWDGTTGEVLDYSGNNNHGTAQADADTIAGKFGSGGTFDGTGDLVNCGNDSSLDITSAITISAWINADTTVDSQRVVDKLRNDAYALRLSDDGSLAVMELAGEFGGVDQTPGNSSIDNFITLGEWTHVSVTYDGAIIRYYVDGMPAGSAEPSPAGDIGTSTVDMAIGARYDGVYEFAGEIDEVRIYNRALSANEVKQLYKWAPGPVMHLKMDENVAGDAQTLRDVSGNGNDGTTDYGANTTGMDCSKPGKYGFGCEFDGTDDHVVVTDTGSDSVLDMTEALTLSAWIYKTGNTSTDSETNLITKADSDGNPVNYWLQVEDFSDTEYLSYYVISDTGTPGEIRSNDPISLNTWHHVTVVDDDDAGTCKLYIDGVSQGETVTYSGHPSGRGLQDNDHNLLIGGLYSGEFYQGLIDDVRLYNYARTQDQIIEDMNAGHPAGGSPVGSPIASWKLDQGHGDTAFDFVGDNDGTLDAGSSGDNTDESEMWDNNGKIGKAIDFDGTDDYIISDFEQSSGSMTASAWIYPETGGEYRIVEDRGLGVSTYPGWQLKIDDDSGDWGLCDCLVVDEDGDYVGGYNKACAGTSRYNYNEWHHILMVFDDSIDDLFMYVDGVLIHTYEDSGIDDYDNSLETHIGATTYSSGVQGSAQQIFDGLIDEVKIYNYAMTANQVKTEFNMGKSLVMGQDPSRDNDGTDVSGAAAEYCVPGSSDPCDPPVLELKMDEMTGTTIYDTSGNGNDGTLGGGTPSYEPAWSGLGKYGSALDFDGNDDYVDFGSPSTLDDIQTTGTGLTFDMWIKLEAYPTGSDQPMFIGKGDENSNGFLGFFLDASSEYIRFWKDFGTAGFGQDLSVKTDFSTSYVGQWKHVAVTWDGTSSVSGVHLYTDAVEGAKYETQNGTGSAVSDASLDMYMGEKNGDYIQGLIDDLKIYNYPRTPAQIAWDFNRGKPVGWWKMDGVSGTQVDDWSGNANHGTMTDMDPATRPGSRQIRQCA